MSGPARGALLGVQLLVCLVVLWVGHLVVLVGLAVLTVDRPAGLLVLPLAALLALSPPAAFGWLRPAGTSRTHVALGAGLCAWTGGVLLAAG